LGSSNASCSAAGEAATALGIRRCVVEFVVKVEGRFVCLGEFLAVLFDIRRGLDLLFSHGHVKLIGADVGAASGTKVRWRPMKPS
jgi:hypothetical protein